MSNWTNNEEYLQEVLDDMNRCDKTCTGLAVDRPKLHIRDVDWLLDNLPGIDYVLDRILNYIFANGVTTGVDEQDDRLEKWLYDDMNRLDATNYSTLSAAIGEAIVRGCCGIRLYDGNLYVVSKGYYGALTLQEDGVKEIVGYFMRKDLDRVEAEIKTEEWSDFNAYEDVTRWFDDNGYILLDRTEFANLRNDSSTLFGYSPLLKDKQRINLILAVYERLNYDIKYDGPGRIILHTKDGFVSDEKNEVSTTEVLNNAPGMVKERYEEAKQEARRIAKDLKDSTSDAVGVMSGAFDKDITHLPRVTKATEFLDWLDVDMVVMAQILGMSPTLLEVGELHGNVSTEKIIDTAMLNTIIPMREKYAIQFSDLIAGRLGVSKVSFNKYDMVQTQDENEIRAKVADIIKSLSYSYKAVETPEVRDSIVDCVELLKTSLYDKEGNIRSLDHA